MVKLLIVDDHPIVRNGLSGEIAKTSDITVVAEASDGDDAIAKVRSCAPDLVLLDIALPGKNGFDLLKQLRAEVPYIRKPPDPVLLKDVSY